MFWQVYSNFTFDSNIKPGSSKWRVPKGKPWVGSHLLPSEYWLKQLCKKICVSDTETFLRPLTLRCLAWIIFFLCNSFSLCWICKHQSTFWKKKRYSIWITIEDLENTAYCYKNRIRNGVLNQSLLFHHHLYSTHHIRHCQRAEIVLGQSLPSYIQWDLLCRQPCWLFFCMYVLHQAITNMPRKGSAIGAQEATSARLGSAGAKSVSTKPMSPWQSASLLSVAPVGTVGSALRRNVGLENVFTREPYHMQNVLVFLSVLNVTNIGTASHFDVSAENAWTVLCTIAKSVSWKKNANDATKIINAVKGTVLTTNALMDLTKASPAVFRHRLHRLRQRLQ